MRSTEQNSRYAHLDEMSTRELLEGINAEDRTVSASVARSLPRIEPLVNAIVARMRKGGRVFYLGSGTSGRLGIVDASEIPPTYGVKDRFIGLIAGGDGAIRTAVEGAEDDTSQGWQDLSPFHPDVNDTLVGITASGTTPYVLSAIVEARRHGLLTACITCNEGSPVAEAAEYPIETVTGPEFVTGSTRMKAGTATKMVLNMISTSVMILLGHVKGCKMVDMELSNAKLVDRGTRMIMEETGITDYELARSMLLEHGHVRQAVEEYKKCSR